MHTTRNNYASRQYLKEKARRKLSKCNEAQQMALIERSVKATAQELNLSEEEVRQALLPEILKLNVQPELKLVNPKVQDIVDKIQRSISDTEKAEELKADHRLNNLYIDLAKAKKDKKLLTESIIQRQIENRAKDVLLMQAERKMARLVQNGKIIDYVAPEDVDAIQRANLQYNLVMEMVDAALLDLKSAIEQAGMLGEVNLLQSIKNVRDEIAAWSGTTKALYGDAGNEIVLAEFDNINDFFKKRLPVLQRKLNKTCNKK